uniref:ubiquitin carboxyl-terminal hydrolase 38-like n=1 Tax=Ciona intestinalis TaxID=7719 RepID=UPI000180B3A7|nr:ubiquitin carboxyl-terminal hydrolase 38-like [Ciona intestinalis]|eukprot:XP_002124170.1 ubiquitin carboxyl-terminal hydrolase 38-like [Ciona intestinalis]
MEQIISGIFLSDHSTKEKKKLFQVVLTSVKSKTESLTQEQQIRIFENCFNFFLSGDEFHSRYAGNIITEYLPFCKEALDTMMSGKKAEEIVISDDNQNTQKNARTLMRRVKLTNILLTGTLPESKSHRHFVLIMKSEVLRLMYDSKEHVSFAEICRLLIKHPTCMPPMNRNFPMCTLSIHAMSDFVLLQEDVKNINNYIQDVRDVALLLNHIWTKAPNLLFPSLKEVFDILSNSNITAEPSNALGCLVELIPCEVIDQAVKQITQDMTVQDTNMYLALNRMVSWLGWPTAQKTHLWILSFFKHLAELNKFQMLIDVTLKSIGKVVACIRLPHVRPSAVAVLVHMLMSCQLSPDAFHIVVSQIPKLLQFLEGENKPQENETYIKQLANLCYCMMHLHSGFPDLYDPLIHAISKHPKPSEEEINGVLKCPTWSASYVSTYHYSYQVARRSTETNMAGLVNMGNTCFMNSIIQALYMAEEFRQLVLVKSREFPTTSISRYLEKTFAFLLKTKREAFQPTEMVEHSKPSWFSHGAQQDCSEYVKYLLEALNEEFKEHSKGTKDSVAQAGTSATESPAAKVQKQSKEISISEFFHGRVKTLIKCSTCKFVSTREEEFLDLALPLNKAYERETPSTGSGGCELGLKPEASNPQPSTSNQGRENTGSPMDTEGATPFVGGEDCTVHGRAIQVEESIEENTEEDVISRNHDLDDLIHQNLVDETLDGSNKYKCPICDDLRKAQKKTVFTKLPVYLMITLMRFTYNTKLQRRTKIMDHVNIPQEIEIPLSNDNTEGYQKYKLWAVVVHSGTSAESGHYYCYGRKIYKESERWYLFNDSHVSFAPFSSIKNLTGRYAVDTPYMLMYARCDRIAPTEGVEVVSEVLSAVIEDDNNKFEKEQKLASERATASSISNILGWNNDNDPPPPSCGGGDGTGIGGNRLVF